jgi:hypothetical protein
MPRHDLTATDLRCPHESCGRVLVRDECGIFCQGCGYEAVTWADPVDADVPMDVLVRRERKLVRLRRICLAAAVALIATLGALFWSARKGEPAGPDLRDPSTVSFAEMRDEFRVGKLPRHLRLPSYYGDAERFLLSRERTSQSALVPWWGARTRDEKLELLDLAIDAESPELLPFLLEISWFTSAQEQDRDVAIGMLQGLYANAKFHVEVAWFVCNHIATTSPISEVQANARRYVADLDDRRRLLGR